MSFSGCIGHGKVVGRARLGEAIVLVVAIVLLMAVVLLRVVAFHCPAPNYSCFVRFEQCY